MGEVEIIDINWALRAAAVNLRPRILPGCIVVWPVEALTRVCPYVHKEA